MRQILKAAALAALLLPGIARAQQPQFPQNLPANTVVGRLGISAGPSQAITFGQLATQLSTSGNYVVGPASSTAGHFAIFDSTTGRLLADHVIQGADLPNPSASTLGGVQSAAAVANSWINSISTSGVPSLSQPAFSNLSGSVACSQLPALTGDVTTSAGSCADVIAANAVTNAKMATAAAYTFKGNATGSTANVTDIDVTALTSKASPVAADIVLIHDSAASNAFKKTTVGALASAGSVSSIAGNTGAFTLSNGLTNSTNDIRIDVGNIPGVTTNSNAAAGKVGEYISSNIASGSAVALTTAVAKDITSISLTAGDWDVQGNVITANSGTITSLFAAISTTSNTLPTPPNAGMYNNTSGISTTSNLATVTGTGRLSLSTTTTVYLETLVGFTGSVSAYGFIGARRMR